MFSVPDPFSVPYDLPEGQTMMHRLLSILLATIALGLGLTSYSAPDRAEDPVVLGAVYNITGRQSVFDKPSLEGARLAVTEVNARGGVLGRQIQLLEIDGESDPATLDRKTSEALHAHPAIVALFGLSDTDMAVAAGRAAARGNRFLLTSGATSPKLPAEVPNHLYLACFGDNTQAAAAAEWAFHSLHARTASVVFNSERTYTRLLHGYFEARFKELGGSIKSVTSFKPGAAETITGGLGHADIIFLATEETGEAVACTERLRAAGFNEPIFGGDGFDTPSAWMQAPQCKDIYYTTHAWLAADNPNPKVRAFLEAYRAANNGETPEGFAAQGYDAAHLLIDAIARAGSDDPVLVQKALAGTTGFNGVTGEINFENGNPVPRKSVALIAVASGKVSLVTTIVPKRVPAP